MSDLQLPRRGLIKGAGLALLASAAGQAAASQSAAAADETASEIWSSEYWAKKGDVPLWMFRKRLGAPKPGGPSRPVVFFVHGSSVTSRVFDLTVPGKGEYSVMNEFARYGFDCWTMDHENYGKSGRTSGNSDIASGVEDLKAAVEVVARETGRTRFHFVGESDWAIHVFRPNNPGDLFHVGLAGHTFVVVVGATTDLERHRVRLSEKSAEDDLFAFGESALDVRPVARVAQRLGCLRLSASNDDWHMVLL